LLFNDYDYKRLVGFFGDSPQVNHGKKMYRGAHRRVERKRAEYEKKIVYDIRDWVKRWDVDFRE